MTDNLAALQDIARRVAALPIKDRCGMCLRTRRNMRLVDHHPTCIYRLAVEATTGSTEGVAR